MDEGSETPEEKPSAAPTDEDDRRAAAAATNRKRALEDWEAKKKRWRETGVPAASPAAGSSKPKS